MNRAKASSGAGSRLLTACLLLLCCTAVAGQLSDDRQGPIFGVLEENDLIVKTDRNYTQGIKFFGLLPDDSMPGVVHSLADSLPPLGYSAQFTKFGFGVGQNIYTPADTKAKELLVNDRPYAGWLYASLTLQRRGFAGGRATALESLELQLGIIGPDSLAEQAQTWMHELRGFSVPQGWGNQLGDEPGLALRYSRAYRLSPEGSHPRYFDFIPDAGFSLGNVETALRAGGTARLGYNLPEDFGVQTISSLRIPDGGWSVSQKPHAWGAYVFTGVEGWLVGYTAFLDGNLFRESHSVEKEIWVGEWKSGFVVVLRNVELGFVYVMRSREFIGQQEEHRYGSVFLKVRL